MKKRTIMVSEEVYDGLFSQIGESRISQFLDNLTHAHVIDSSISSGYEAMANDENREKNAIKWSENLIGDADHEAW